LLNLLALLLVFGSFRCLLTIQKYATEGDENTTSYEEATPTEEPQAEIEVAEEPNNTYKESIIISVRLAGKVREGADIKPPFPLAHVYGRR
jgi:hypothetical protein